MFKIQISKQIELKACRDGFGEALLELGKRNKDVVVVSADLAESTRCLEFGKKYAERFFEVGVAEQNMAGVAAGLALEGKIPFMCSFGVFSPARNWDQIRISICYNKANVLAAAKFEGPVYIRFAREKSPIMTLPKTKFKIGNAEVFKEGDDVTIIACGSMVYEALLAAKELKKEKIQAEVINCHTIKPIDAKTIIRSAKKTNRVVTIEEHQVNGGLGSAVAEVLAQNYPVPMKIIGMPDKFGESGTGKELLDKYGLNYLNIIKEIKKLI
ncbi:MAG: transketolase family protein [Candidatus Parcubacteria bacterium]|nr:transketolase family protein [Candidatus Parcubacteria bacterium]